MKRIAAITLGMFLCLPAILPAHEHCNGHSGKGCEKCNDCGKCKGCANCKHHQADKKSGQPADTQKK